MYTKTIQIYEGVSQNVCICYKCALSNLKCKPSATNAWSFARIAWDNLAWDATRDDTKIHASDAWHAKAKMKKEGRGSENRWGIRNPWPSPMHPSMAAMQLLQIRAELQQELRRRYCIGGCRGTVFGHGPLVWKSFCLGSKRSDAINCEAGSLCNSTPCQRAPPHHLYLLLPRSR